MGNQSTQDECTWYFLTFLIDLFPGILILTFLLNLSNRLFYCAKLNQLVSGNYIQEYHGTLVISLKAYIIQIIIWIAISIFNKLILLAIELYLSLPLILLSQVVFKLMDFSGDIKLFFVLVFFPLFANIFIFWISDSLL